MRRKPPNTSDPTMATHFPSLSRNLVLNPDVHMFMEDVHLGVIPIGGRTEKLKNFTITLDGKKEECERASYILDDLGEYNRHYLPEMVCDAVEDIASHLAWEGCALYEIVKGDNGEVHVHSFTSKRLVRFPGWFIQIIPRGDWQLWEKKWVIIPANKVWHIEMPLVLGGCRGYKNTLKRLKMFQHLGPSFWKKDLETGVQSRAFDFQKYVRSTEIYYERMTRAWGWNRRDWSQDRSTEFFNFYKMITFRWAQSVLCEHIITELNNLFNRLGIVCELKVTGLPTPSEILQIRRDLQEGTITFTQASDRVSL
ncbi:MAG: hypothetical protein ACYC6Q_04280 [Syntrophales bacterium]